MALSQGMLREIGGFEAILDDLADDFLLGNGVKRAGYRVVIANYMVENVLGAEPFGTMWARRLRWARTVRAYRPEGLCGGDCHAGNDVGSPVRNRHGLQ